MVDLAVFKIKIFVTIGYIPLCYGSIEKNNKISDENSLYFQSDA